ELAQLVVDQRQQLLGGGRVALLDGTEDVRNLAHGREDNRYARAPQESAGRRARREQRPPVRAPCRKSKPAPARWGPLTTGRDSRERWDQARSIESLTVVGDALSHATETAAPGSGEPTRGGRGSSPNRWGTAGRACGGTPPVASRGRGAGHP